MSTNILRLLDRHLAKTEVDPLGTLGVFHCFQHQQIRRVPIQQASMVLVFRGEKRILLSAASHSIATGELVMLPAGSDVSLENLPCPQQHEYLALSVGFSNFTVQGFLDRFGSQIDWQQQAPQLKQTIPQALYDALEYRLVQRLQGRKPSPIMYEVQQQELLAICSEFGLLGFLAPTNHGDWKQRVAAIVGLDLAYEWRIADLCRRLAVSESVLRRHLQEEGTSYREILEQARLVTALALLQETPITIAQVAAQVGYQSQSRFTERFKQRFGITPSQLKASRKKAGNPALLAEIGELLAEKQY